MFRSMNYVILVLVLIIYYGSDIRVSGQVGGGPSDLVGSRMTLACGAQPTFHTAKIFDDCLTDRGLDYRFLDVCKPCGKIAGLDMSTYKGVWEFSCLQQGTNRDKTRDCIVDQMKKQVPSMDIMSLSIKAMEKCKECVEKLAKQNAKNGEDMGAKKKANEAKKKAQEEAKKNKGGGGGGGGGGDNGKGSGDGGKGGGDGGKGGGDGGKGGGGDGGGGGGGGKRRRKGGIFGGKRRSRTTSKPGSEQQTQQQKKSKQQQMNKAPARKVKPKE